MPDLRIQPFKEYPYQKNENPGYDSQPAKGKPYLIYLISVDIPKPNETGRNQDGFDRVYQALWNIKQGGYIDAYGV